MANSKLDSWRTVVDQPSKVGTLLTTNEAAYLLLLSPKTLDKDRCTRELGIPFVKIGRSVRYRRSDLEKFIAERVVE